MSIATKTISLLTALILFGALSVVQASPVPAQRAARPDAETACSRTKPSPTPTYDSFYGRQQGVEGSSPEWQVRLEAWEPLEWPPQQFTFRATNRETGTTSQFTLWSWAQGHQGLRVNQVVEIDPLSGNRALILGLAAARASVANVVDLPSGTIVDRFDCAEPILSPNRRFLAFQKSFPLHPGPVAINAEYLVYDLTQPAAFNRPRYKPGVTYDAGWPVYPPGATNAAGENLVPGLSAPTHEQASYGQFWLGDETVAFVDRWHDINSLVVADVSAGVRHPRVAVRRIETDRLTDFASCEGKGAPSDLRRWRSHPGSLVEVTDIECLAAKPGWVRLTLAPHDCLGRRTLDIPIGP